ncbi:MAG: hypothetical protein ACFE9Z_00470 [Promethearchaeota archaeon]
MEDKNSIKLIILASIFTILIYVALPFIILSYLTHWTFGSIPTLIMFVPSLIIISISIIFIILLNFWHIEPSKKILICRNLSFAQMLMNIFFFVLFAGFFFVTYIFGFLLTLIIFSILRQKLNEKRAYVVKDITIRRKNNVIVLLVLTIPPYVGVGAILIGAMLSSFLEAQLAIATLLSFFDFFGYQALSFITFIIIPGTVILILNIKEIEITTRFLVGRSLSLTTLIFAFFCLVFSILFVFLYGIFLVIILLLIGLYAIEFIISLLVFLFLRTKKKQIL